MKAAAFLKIAKSFIDIRNKKFLKGITILLCSITLLALLPVTALSQQALDLLGHSNAHGHKDLRYAGGLVRMRSGATLCIRVTTSFPTTLTDGTDIGFDVNGYVDVAAIAALLPGGTGTVYVTRIYDQSGYEGTINGGAGVQIPFYFGIALTNLSSYNNTGPYQYINNLPTIKLTNGLLDNKNLILGKPAIAWANVESGDPLRVWLTAVNSKVDARIATPFSYTSTHSALLPDLNTTTIVVKQQNSNGNRQFILGRGDSWGVSYSSSTTHRFVIRQVDAGVSPIDASYSNAYRPDVLSIVSENPAIPGAKYSLFSNGALFASSPNMSDHFFHASMSRNPVTLGNRQQDNDFALRGKISAVVMYGSVLSTNPADGNNLVTLQNALAEKFSLPINTLNSSLTFSTGSGLFTVPLTKNNPNATLSWVRGSLPNGITTTTPSSSTVGVSSIQDELTNNTTSSLDVKYTVTIQDQTINGISGGTNTQEVVVTVKPTPQLNTISQQSLCSGGIVSQSLSANIAGATFSWSRQSITNIGGNLTPGTIYTTNTISEALTNSSSAPIDVTYSITVTLNGVSSTGSFVVTVSPQSVSGTIQGPSAICTNASLTLSLQNSVGQTITWQKSNTGQFTGEQTTIATDVTSFAETSLLPSTLYYYRAQVQSGPCLIENSEVKQVVVDPLSSLGSGISGTAQICQGSGTTLTVGNLTSITGSVVGWQSASNSEFTNNVTSIPNTTTTLNITSLNATTFYRVEVKSGACASVTNNTPYQVLVDAPSAVSQIYDDHSGATTVCISAAPNNWPNHGISTNGLVGSIVRWETATNSGFTENLITRMDNSLPNPIPIISNPIRTVNHSEGFVGTMYYRAVVKNGTCPEVTAPGRPIRVDQSVPNNISMTAVSSVCSGGTIIFTINNNGITQISDMEQASTQNGSYTTIWDEAKYSNAKPIFTFTQPSVTQSRWYRARVRNGACANVLVSAIEVKVDAQTVGGEVTTQNPENVCANSNSTILNLANNTGSVVRWEYSLAGNFTDAVPITNTNTSITALNLNTSTSYRAVVKNETCPEANSAPLRVTVKPLPVITSDHATPIQVCHSVSYSIPSFQATNHPGTQFNWLANDPNLIMALGATSGSGSITGSYTGNNTTTASISATIQITPTLNGCVGSTVTQTVSVKPVPDANTINSISLCNESQTIFPSFTSNISNTTFNWVVTNSDFLTIANNTGNGDLGQITGVNTGILNRTVTIRFTPVFEGCSGSELTTTVTVKPTPNLSNNPATAICSGGNLSFTPTSTLGNTTITWSRTNNQNLTNDAVIDQSGNINEVLNLYPLVTSITPINYVFQLIDNNGCSKTVTKEVYVNPLPRLLGVEQLSPIPCGNGNATIKLSGLIPSSTFGLTYTINGQQRDPVSSVTATTLGVAEFSVQLFNTDLNRQLAITQITRNDVSPFCTANITSDNLISSLNVSPTPTLGVIEQSQTVCENNDALIVLNGLLPNSVSTIEYSIDGIVQTPITNISSNSSGSASFSKTLAATDADKTLTVTKIIRTDADACQQNFSANTTLRVDLQTIAGSVSSNDAVVCRLNNNQATLILEDARGRVLHWESSEQSFNVGGVVKRVDNSSNTNSIVVDNLSTTTFYRAVVKSGTCQELSSNYDEVTVVNQPTANIAVPNQAVCANVSPAVVGLTASGGAGTATYQWFANSQFLNTGGTSLGVNNGAQTTDFLPSANANEGNYYYYAEVTYSGSGCMVAKSNVFTLNVKRYAVANDIAVTPDNPTVCAGLTQTFAASLSTNSNISNPTFQWYSNNLFTNLLGSGNTYSTGELFNPTSVYVRVSGDNVCPNLVLTGKLATVNVNNTAPEVDRPTDKNVCHNTLSNTVTFTGTSGATFSWVTEQSNFGLTSFSGTGSVPSFTGINTGAQLGVITIKVTPSNSDGCVGVEKSFTITVVPPVNPGNQAIQVCSGASFTIDPTNAPSGTTYQWNVPNVSNVIGQTASTGYVANYSQTLTNLGNADISVVYTLTPRGAGGCDGTPFDYTVLVKKLPFVNTVNTEVCSGSPFVISPSNPLQGQSYTWQSPVVSPNSTDITGGGAQISQTNTISQTLVNTTTNSVTAQYTIIPYNGSCQGSAFTANVSVKPRPVLNSATTVSICNLTPFNYNAISNMGNSNTSFVWERMSKDGINNGATNGLSDISEVLENTTNDPVTVEYNYTLTAGGCQNSQKVSVVVNPTLKLNSAKTNLATCSGSGFSYNPSSPTTGTTFSWDRSLTQGIRNVANAGGGDIYEVLVNETNTPVTVRYVYTVKLGTTCQNQENVDVVVGPVPTVNNISAMEVCNGDMATVSFSGSTINGTTYKWTNSNTFIGLTNNGSDNISFRAQNSGDRPLLSTILVTPEFAGCTGQSKSFNVTVKPTPVLSNANIQTAYCSNSTIQFTPQSNTSGASIEWERISMGSIAQPPTSGSGIINEQLTNISNAPANVSYRFNIGAGGCSNSQTVVFTINPKPTVINPGDMVVCNGTSQNISFSGSQVHNTVYRWVNSNPLIGLSSSGSDAIFFNGVNNTADTILSQITVTPTANTCEGDPQTFKLFVNPSLKMSSSALITPICSNAVFSYTPSTIVPGTTFTWVRSAVSGISNSTANGTGSIQESLNNTTSSPVLVTYEYTLTNNGCQSKQNIIVQVNPAIAITNITNSAAVCSNDGYSFLPISNVAGAQYQWSRESVAGITNFAASGSGPINEKLVNNTDAPINVVYKFVVGFSNTCTNQQEMTVVVKPLPKLTSDKTIIACTNAAIAYKPTSDISGTSFVWTRTAVNGISNSSATGAGNIGEMLLSTVNVPVVTEYTYQLTNVNGCVNNEKVQVTVNPAPVASFVRDQSICAGNTVNAIDFVSNFSNVNYTWTNSDPTIGLAPSGIGNIPSFTAQNTSSGPLTGIIQVIPDLNGCKGASVTVARITVNRPISASFIETAPTTACPSTNVGPFTAGIPLGGDGYNYAFQWQVSLDGTNFQNIVGQTSRQLTAPPINGDRFFRMITESGGCAAVTQAVKVELKNTPTITVKNHDNYTVSIGNSTQVFVTGGTNYLWTPAAFVSDPQSANPFLSPRTDTRYTVRVTNDFGCSKDTSLQIKVITAYQIEPNNILTPNGDGFNDLWKIKNIEFYPKNSVKIFNANGVLVKDLPNYTGNWDGTVNGVKLAMGTYYYQIKLNDGDAIIKGYITIIN